MMLSWTPTLVRSPLSISLQLGGGLQNSLNQKLRVSENYTQRLAESATTLRILPDLFYVQ